MSQSVVTVRLNGTPYQIGCETGEEDHVARLGVEVEEILQGLVGAVGQIGEARLLAMAAVILADKASDIDQQGTENEMKADRQSGDIEAEVRAAEALEAAAKRIGALAANVAAGSSS